MLQSPSLAFAELGGRDQVAVTMPRQDTSENTALRVTCGTGDLDSRQSAFLQEPGTEASTFVFTTAVRWLCRWERIRSKTTIAGIVHTKRKT